MTLPEPYSFDREWTLFLDRDGVINRRIYKGYVLGPAKLDLLPGVPEAIAGLNSIFGRTLVVTNQRGITLGLMSEYDLHKVHEEMMSGIEDAGGKIDAIYYCPHDRDAGCECRKPGTGMALQAKNDFPEIDFSKSVMVGDTSGDMEMGRKLGMVCIWIDTGMKDKVPSDYDERFESLSEFLAFID